MRDDGASARSPRACCCRPTPRASSRWPRAPRPDELFWVDPQRRGILPLDGLHVSAPARPQLPARRLRDRRRPRLRRRARRLRRPRRRPGSTPRSARLYRDLHRLGHAHSVEIWQDGALAGGLYGVALGAAFFGESMFSRRRDASKFALIALVARLHAGGFRLLDTQFVTDHLARLGAVEISRAAYHRRLDAARRAARRASARCPRDASRQSLLQLTHPDVVARVVERRERRRGGEHPAREARRLLAHVADAQERVGVAVSGRPRGTRQASAVISRWPKRTVSPTPDRDVLGGPVQRVEPAQVQRRSPAASPCVVDALHRLRRHRLRRRRAPARRRASSAGSLLRSRSA